MISLKIGGLYKMTLGERVKVVRKNNNLNQTLFAESIGISQTHVSKIEKDIENPSETLIRFISYMYGVSYDWLKNESGSYSGVDGSTAVDYYSLLISVRYKMENRAKYMNTDSIWEYVDTIKFFDELLDCCDIKHINDEDVIRYYTSLKRVVFNLLLLTKSTEKDVIDKSRTKETLHKEIDKLIDFHNKI